MCAAIPAFPVLCLCLALPTFRVKSKPASTLSECLSECGPDGINNLCSSQCYAIDAQGCIQLCKERFSPLSDELLQCHIGCAERAAAGRIGETGDNAEEEEKAGGGTSGGGAEGGEDREPEGDGLDNDGDGLVDEEGENGAMQLKGCGMYITTMSVMVLLLCWWV